MKQREADAPRDKWNCYANMGTIPDQTEEMIADARAKLAAAVSAPTAPPLAPAPPAGPPPQTTAAPPPGHAPSTTATPPASSGFLDALR